MSQRSKRVGYAAFLICGLCVALNLLAYLPGKTFEDAEAVEFTVTLPLIVVFLFSSLIAWTCAAFNRRDLGLVALLLLSIAFVVLTSLNGSYGSQMRRALQFTYAITVLVICSARLLLTRHSAA